MSRCSHPRDTPLGAPAPSPAGLLTTCPREISRTSASFGPQLPASGTMHRQARRGLRGDVGGRESGDSHWVNGEDGGYGEIGRRGRRRSEDEISGLPPAVPAWNPSIHAYDAGVGPDFSVGWAQLPMGVLTPTPDSRPDEPTWPHRPSWLPEPRPTCRSPRRR